MKLLDANLLIYAYDSSSPFHLLARKWVEDLFNRGEPVRMPWSTIQAFLRITTNPRILNAPLKMADAVAIANEWLAQPSVDVVEPGGRYWPIFTKLLAVGQVRGALVMDAHLAAIAIEHGAVLQTTDRDFSRFPGLRFENPLAT